MKLKNAAILLMVSSIYWILVNLYSGIKAFTKAWDYYKNNLIDLAIDRLFIIIPISLLVLSIALMKDKKEEPTVHETKNNSRVDDYENPGVGDWLLNFLVTLIPLVGLIFTIIWSTDTSNKVRKNWALASLIWSAILFVFFLMYISVFTLSSRGFY